MKPNVVITGDLIQSTRLNDLQRLELINKIQLALKQWSGDFKFRSEFFRGDSFQCYTENAALSLRIMLLIKTHIKSLNPSGSFMLANKAKPEKKSSIMLPYNFIDARIAMGIGSATVGKSLATSNGEAFILSGHLLDEMKERKQTIGIISNDMFTDELATESVLLDAILSKTTALQCEVINYKLLYYNETEIARKLNINQSAVNHRSRTGNWNAINTMIERFETIYNNE